MATVYNYDRVDCFFLGEKIADLDPRQGTPMLPAFSTFIEPPSKATDGADIAVFSPASNAWEMRPNSYWRPRISRRLVRLDHPLTGDLRVTQLPLMHFKYKGIPRVIASSAISMSLSGRLRHIECCTNQINAIHSQRAHGHTMEAFLQVKMTSEDLVVHVKRFLDDVFMHEWLELERESETFLRTKRVELQGFNEVESLKSGRTKDHLLAMKARDPGFFFAIRDLRNSFAHHLAVPEAYYFSGVEHPTVNTFYMKGGDVNDVELIEVLVEDITKSLNRFIHRTFGH